VDDWDKSALFSSGASSRRSSALLGASMAIFELHAASKPDGSFAAAWFDDDEYRWNDERLSTAGSLARSWHAPSLRLHRPEAGATPVLFNPNALAVSERVKAELSSFTELEYLPLHIEGHGAYYILHVTSAIELPIGSDVRMAPESGNIVQIGAFPASFEPQFAFFRVLQPLGSAARRVSATTRAIYRSGSGVRAFESCADGYLVAADLLGIWRSVGDADVSPPAVGV
jgi:hypothetical protein